ncbi:hypothetical protein CIT292_07370 [Citrobacter youngae ATCC 29220]|uniref:Uncharacterized protein n=1 Tax=Citrobacter youngae ATCC 29220 TaxID=500640 RepID=D4BA78_9ENTR|nr:hypothetical protein CIT292_07370 [Citrobacter youngae ATCC 29220]
MLKQKASIGFILDNHGLDSEIRFDFLLIVAIDKIKKAPRGRFFKQINSRWNYYST